MEYPNRDQEVIIRMRELSHPLEPLATDATAHLRSLNRIKAVIFDIYGTLLISGSGDINPADEDEAGMAIREAFKSIGQTISGEITAAALADLFFMTIAKARNALKANGIDYPDIDIRDIWFEVWEHLYHDGILGESPQPGQIPLLSAEYECRVNPTWPMKDFGEIFPRLSEKGFILGIISNAQFFTPLLFETHLHQNLADLGFRDDLCFFSYAHEIAKPSPRFFEKCAERLNDRYHVQPEEVLYVGNDMLNDVWASQNAGFRTLLFAGDRRSLRLRHENPYLQNLRPDAVITTLPQLMNVI